MNILYAILLGILEGFTEFLPISSTGHLLLAQDLISYKDTAEIFTVVIQTGALGAVIWYYRQDLSQKLKGLINKDARAIQFWKLLIVATLPAVVAGLLVKTFLGLASSLVIIALALIVGGVIIWLVEAQYQPKISSNKPQLNKITLKQAFLVGCYQILALVPGVSRSGSTIIGGLLTGLDRVTATTFSFYLSMPILLLAGLYMLISGHDELSTISGGGVALLAGTIASFITAFLVIGWLLKYVSKHDFKLFAYYRIILGIIIIFMLMLTT